MSILPLELTSPLPDTVKDHWHSLTASDLDALVNLACHGVSPTGEHEERLVAGGLISRRYWTISGDAREHPPGYYQLTQFGSAMFAGRQLAKLGRYSI